MGKTPQEEKDAKYHGPGVDRGPQQTTEDINKVAENDRDGNYYEPPKK